MKGLSSALLNPELIHIRSRKAVTSNQNSNWGLRSSSGYIHLGRFRVSYRPEWGYRYERPMALCVANSSRENNGSDEEEEKKGWVHFLGIGGSGLSALAMLALKQGWRVSGSDVTWSIYMNALERAGAKLHIGHSSAHLLEKNRQISLPDAVVVSSAIPEDNKEIAFATSMKIQIYERDAWLAKITQRYNVLAVSGSHGKSTTAAMLAFVLRSLGDDITAIVGANVPQFPEGGNAIAGHGPWFVLEADEYKECFLGISPLLAVVTNVEWEHVDTFQDEASVRDVFRRFLMRIKPGGILVVCGDSPGSRSLLEAFQPKKFATCGSTSAGTTQCVGFNLDCHIITYGLGENNDWRAVSLTSNAKGGTDYVVVIASVAMLTEGHDRCSAVGNDLEETREVVKDASRHLANFIGICRRFDFVGKICGCDIYDDYAHHPTEVLAVLQAARQRFTERAVWVVFQPHTYSRLAGLLEDFAVAFNDADRVIITKVYAAREKNIWNVSGEELASSIMGPSVEYIPELEDVLERLISEIPSYGKEIVILTLGAGDITTLGPRLLGSLTRHNL